MGCEGLAPSQMPMNGKILEYTIVLVLVLSLVGGNLLLSVDPSLQLSWVSQLPTLTGLCLPWMALAPAMQRGSAEAKQSRSTVVHMEMAVSFPWL